MAYGSLGFGLLTGALGPNPTFADNDWRRRGIAFGLPLFEAEWLAKEARVAERLAALAAEHDKSLPQMAISWVLDNPAVSVALVGMRNEQELDENVAAAEWRLPAELRTAIDEVFADEGVPTYVDHPQQLHPR